MADTIAGLCMAIDSGEDELLPILADALEDAEDERAAGLRRIGDRRPQACHGYDIFVWRRQGPAAGGEEFLPGDVHDRLCDGVYGVPTHYYGGWAYRRYESRSAAYLDLAAALAAS